VVGSAVVAEGVEFSFAARCGAYVESNCSLTARECKFLRNGHYGVQTQPKARAVLENCTFALNRRGDRSGNDISIENTAAL
jgi:hypothetical protein